LARDSACREALAVFTTVTVQGDVLNKIAYLISSTTLVILLKKDAEIMTAMKDALGADYVQPHRPLGMGSILVYIASNCALIMLRGSFGVVVGPSQFSVETKVGCDLIQWAL
jgi:hypothetical protein